MRRQFTGVPEPDPDEPFTFTDVTVLAFLTGSTLAVAVLLSLGVVSAAHRIAVLFGHA